ncbi:MAG: S-ribosylhomocysteine lyase [Tissierellia bacterium]|nr:S-ribosylhomocysteine lyase [Tissierellia bacterium]
MKKIPSFEINHLNLKKGCYISRVDEINKTRITTFDLRMTDPNDEPVMETSAIHAIEHLGATYLRNSSHADQVIYFGPMGCRTGFYLLLEGKYKAKDILPLLLEMFDFIVNYQGDIPGASPRDCGNYQDMNLDMAKYYSRIYLQVLKNISQDRLVYPK